MAFTLPSYLTKAPTVTSSLKKGTDMGPIAAAAIPAIASLITSFFGSKQKNKETEDQTALQRQALAQDAQQSAAGIALNESEMDPFRHSMFQGNDIAALDKMERASFTPTQVSGVPARYAGSVPKFTGGYSYTKSPEMIASAAALKQQVMSGQGAPTMTKPANYGRTGAIDLVGIAAGAKQPGTPGALANAPDPVAQVTNRWYKQDDELDPEEELRRRAQY